MNEKHTLFCGKCGTENPETAEYCKHCGSRMMKPNSNTTQQSKPINEPIPTCDTTVKSEHSTTPSVCPYCNGTACTPVVKSEVKTKKYGFFEGILGLIAFGPAGLLCGLCGSSSTKVKNETWWVCPDCGKEFISKESAIARAKHSMVVSAIYSAIFSGIGFLAFLDSWSFWVILIAALAVVCVWAAVIGDISKTSGYDDVNDILTTPAEKYNFWSRYVELIIISIVIGGVIIGGGIYEFMYA